MASSGGGLTRDEQLDVCVDMAGGKKGLIPTLLLWESQGSALCLSFSMQKGWGKAVGCAAGGERLWDVLIDLLPDKNPLLMQCTNGPFPALSPSPAVDEHTLTPPCSLEGGMGCACWKGLTRPHPWK